MTKAEILSLFSGTSNRISFVNGAIDISSSYTGQNTITTVGTIGTGVWNGSSIASGYGGTGFNSYAKGDLIYASAVNTLAKLAAGTDGQVLTLASGVPTWAAAGGLPSQTGNSGKYLTTDGTSASWGTVSASVNTASNYTWTGLHTFNNSVTASAGVAKGVVMTPTLVAAANNDVLTALDINPTMTPGSFTGVKQYSAKFNGSIYVDGTAVGYSQVGIWMVDGGAIRGTASTGGNIYIDANTALDGTGTIHFRGATSFSNPITSTSYAATGTGPSYGLTDGGSIRNTGTSSNGTMYIDASNGAISGTIHMRTSTVNIGTITSVSSAMLQLVSTTKGFLPPKMTTTQKNAISSPASGLVVYDTTLNKLCVFTGSVWETITSS